MEKTYEIKIYQSALQKKQQCCEPYEADSSLKSKSIRVVNFGGRRSCVAAAVWSTALSESHFANQRKKCVVRRRSKRIAEEEKYRNPSGLHKWKPIERDRHHPAYGGKTEVKSNFITRK